MSVTSKRHPAFPLLVALLLWLGLVVLARGPEKASAASGQNGIPPGTTSITAAGYYPDAQMTQPWRGPLNTADTTTLSTGNLATFTVANGGRIRSLGRPNIPVSLRFTQPNQSACVLYVAIYVNPGDPTTNHLNGISDLTTLTATNITDVDGRFMAPTWVFDSYGGTDGIVLLVSPPASGNVYMDPGSY